MLACTFVLVARLPGTQALRVPRDTSTFVPSADRRVRIALLHDRHHPRFLHVVGRPAAARVDAVLRSGAVLYRRERHEAVESDGALLAFRHRRYGSSSTCSSTSRRTCDDRMDTQRGRRSTPSSAGRSRGSFQLLAGYGVAEAALLRRPRDSVALGLRARARMRSRSPSSPPLGGARRARASFGVLRVGRRGATRSIQFAGVASARSRACSSCSLILMGGAGVLRRSTPAEADEGDADPARRSPRSPPAAAGASTTVDVPGGDASRAPAADRGLRVRCVPHDRGDRRRRRARRPVPRRTSPTRERSPEPPQHAREPRRLDPGPPGDRPRTR